jgi:hypothetical protein
VIRGIIGKSGSQVRCPIGLLSSDSPLWLTARHFPSRIASTVTQVNPRRKCYVCTNTVRRVKSRRDTSYEFIGCDVEFCLTEFENEETIP